MTAESISPASRSLGSRGYLLGSDPKLTAPKIVVLTGAMLAFVFLGMILLDIAITLWLPGERPAPLCGRMC